MSQKLSDYDNAPLEIREKFAPSPDMVQRSHFDSTKRELRYQVGRIDLAAFVAGQNPIIEHPVSGAVYIYILKAVADQILLALDSGDFVNVIGGDSFRMSPIEKVRVKRNQGAGVSTLMFIYSNDPLFEFNNGGDFSGRAAWNPSGSN